MTADVIGNLPRQDDLGTLGILVLSLYGMFAIIILLAFFGRIMQWSDPSAPTQFFQEGWPYTSCFRPKVKLRAWGDISKGGSFRERALSAEDESLERLMRRAMVKVKLTSILDPAALKVLEEIDSSRLVRALSKSSPGSFDLGSSTDGDINDPATKVQLVEMHLRSQEVKRHQSRRSDSWRQFLPESERTGSKVVPEGVPTDGSSHFASHFGASSASSRRVHPVGVGTESNSKVASGWGNVRSVVVPGAHLAADPFETRHAAGAAEGAHATVAVGQHAHSTGGHGDIGRAHGETGLGRTAPTTPAPGVTASIPLVNAETTPLQAHGNGSSGGGHPNGSNGGLPKRPLWGKLRDASQLGDAKSSGGKFSFAEAVLSVSEQRKATAKAEVEKLLRRRSPLAAHASQSGRSTETPVSPLHPLESPTAQQVGFGKVRLKPLESSRAASQQGQPLNMRQLQQQSAPGGSSELPV